MTKTNVHVDNQVYRDWASPNSAGQDDGKLDKYASLDVFFNGDTNRLVFAFRRTAKLKTDMSFELALHDARNLYEVLRRRFEE